MTTRNILIASLLFISVIGCLQTAGNITGTVKDAGGNSLAGVLVYVQPANNAAVTNTSGKYTIANLSLGEYTVTAATGSYTATKTVTIADEGTSCAAPEIQVDLQF